MNCIRCGEPLDALHIVDGCKKRTIDDMIEQAARVLCALDHGDPDDLIREYDDCGRVTTSEFAWTEYVAQAQALADAGLLAQTVDEIALDRLQELAEARGYNRGFHIGWDAALDQMKGQDR